MTRLVITTEVASVRSVAVQNQTGESCTEIALSIIPGRRRGFGRGAPSSPRSSTNNLADAVGAESRLSNQAEDSDQFSDAANTAEKSAEPKDDEEMGDVAAVDAGDDEMADSGEDESKNELDVTNMAEINRWVPYHKEGGKLQPPWSHRRDRDQIKAWRKLTKDDQSAEKRKWKALGAKAQKSAEREVRRVFAKRTGQPVKGRGRPKGSKDGRQRFRRRPAASSEPVFGSITARVLSASGNSETRNDAEAAQIESHARLVGEDNDDLTIGEENDDDLATSADVSGSGNDLGE